MIFILIFATLLVALHNYKKTFIKKMILNSENAIHDEVIYNLYFVIGCLFIAFILS